METTQNTDSEAGSAGAERRRGNRVPTHRPALISAPPDRALCQGTVLDISAGGMQIRTHAPLSRGTFLEIEVQRRDEEDTRPPIYGRGVVVWTRQEPDGALAFGIRLRTGRPQMPTGREPSLDPRLLRPEHRPPTYAPGGQALKIGDRVRFRAAAHKRRWLPFLLLLGLVTALGAGVWTLVRDHVLLPTRPTLVNSQDAVVEDTVPIPNTTVRLPPQETGFVPPPLDTDWGPLDTAYERLLEGMPGTAAKLFRIAQEDPLTNPAERFAARVGEAESLLASDERQDAVAALDRAMQEPEGVAEPWRAVARDLRLRILRGENVDTPVLFARVLEFTERNAAAQTLPPLGRNAADNAPNPVLPPMSTAGSAGAQGIRLEVSTSRYLLTVMEGDRTLGIFPVGVGRDRATPYGDFQVANKILEPDWYNRGRVVTAGDSENPLGELWVGLGKNGRPTPFGIHPTAETESIGRDLSAGCIRMRPEDARTIFQWVSIGTPVRIGP